MNDLCHCVLFTITDHICVVIWEYIQQNNHWTFCFRFTFYQFNAIILHSLHTHTLPDPANERHYLAVIHFQWCGNFNLMEIIKGATAHHICIHTRDRETKL